MMITTRKIIGNIEDALATIYQNCCTKILQTLTLINVSASDLRQESSAVIPHAWDLYVGCRATGIPTKETIEFLIFNATLSFTFYD